MNKQCLDEMQIQRRNKIGNQSFLLLLYLLLLDAGLYGFGFRWISYPVNTMLIITVCGAYYTVRLIMGNAYVGPTEKKPLSRTVIAAAAAAVTAAVVVVVLKALGAGNGDQADSLSAPILLIASATAIMIMTATALIKKWQNRDDSE